METLSLNLYNLTMNAVIVLIGIPTLLRLSAQLGRILERFDSLERRVKKNERHMDYTFKRIGEKLLNLKSG